MSWGEVKKINSELSIPLNAWMQAQTLVDNIRAESVEMTFRESGELGLAIAIAWGLDRATLSPLKDIAAVAGSAAAITEIVTSDAAIETIASSDTALAALAVSDTFMAALMGSDAALGTIMARESAMAVLYGVTMTHTDGIADYNATQVSIAGSTITQSSTGHNSQNANKTYAAINRLLVKQTNNVPTSTSNNCRPLTMGNVVATGIYNAAAQAAGFCVSHGGDASNSLILVGGETRTLASSAALKTLVIYVKSLGKVAIYDGTNYFCESSVSNAVIVTFGLANFDSVGNIVVHNLLVE